MINIITYNRNIIITITALLVLLSCTPGLETSITEPLPASELEKLDIQQAKLYDKLQKILSHKSKSELATLVDVTYADYFHFVSQVNQNQDIWRKEAYEKWLRNSRSALERIDNYYQKWVEWERENSLDKKFYFKIHKIKMPDTPYGSQRIDFDLISYVGRIKRIYIDFGFDTPENNKKNKTEEFSVSVILGDHILADAPIGDTFYLTDVFVHNTTPEYLIGKSSEEILSKYKLLTKVSSVTLEDNTEIYHNSHLKQIPTPIVDLWKKEKKHSVNYKDIEGFYDNEAAEIASLANVEYQPMTQYIEERILERMNAINPLLVSIYKEL